MVLAVPLTNIPTSSNEALSPTVSDAVAKQHRNIRGVRERGTLGALLWSIGIFTGPLVVTTQREAPSRRWA
jgi:hypothetical protein